ncbi:MAG: hypothetical protein EAZ42_03985 [Verrucomicrobia bacterium]|nr:MAG: hypothetical protein EAZ42_03985 [Verrucomicrobiota bacterium]
MPEHSRAIDSDTEAPYDAFSAFDDACSADGVFLPGYLILGEISRGGMGVVYHARQIRPQREVAVKILLPQYAAEPEMLARFQIEARAMASLDHPGILPVYEVGEASGLPFFSMKLATGGSLADRLKSSGALAPREAATLMEQLARAVHHAHQHGVLHRDLKPGNFLFDENSRAHVSDFGLAKLPLTAAVGALTQPESFFGTPHYMPPEVARGSVAEATIAGDLYSLGAVLYECLSGQRPYAQHTAAAPLLRAIADDPITPLKASCPSIARDLTIVCMKALEKNPAARYATVAEFAGDLAHWLAGEPITARPIGTLEKTLRWARQHPLPAALATGLAVVTLTGGVLLTQSHRERGAALHESRKRLHSSLIDQAQKERLLGVAGYRSRALALLQQAQALAACDEILTEAAALLVRPDIAMPGQQVAVQPSRPPLADDAVLHQHGNAAGWQLTLHQSGRAALWQQGEAMPRQIWLPRAGRTVVGEFFQAEGNSALLLAETLEGHFLLRLPSLEKLAQLPEMDSAILWTTIAPAGGSAVIGSAQGLQRVDFKSSHVVWQLHGGAARCQPAWSSSGQQVAAAMGDERGLWLHDAADGRRLWHWESSAWPVSIAFHPNRPWLAVACDDGSISLLDVVEKRTWARLDFSAQRVSFSPDGSRLSAHTLGGTAWEWPLEFPHGYREWSTGFSPEAAERGTAFGLKLSPNGQQLLTTATEGVRLWDLAAGRETGFYSAENQRIDAPTSAWWLSDHELLVQMPGGLERVKIDPAGQPGPPARVPRQPGMTVLDVLPDGAWRVKLSDPEQGDQSQLWRAGDPTLALTDTTPPAVSDALRLLATGEIDLTPLGRKSLSPRRFTPPRPLHFRAAIIHPDGKRLLALAQPHHLVEWNLEALSEAVHAEIP